MNIEKKGNIEQKGIWPADVWPADDILLCSIFPFFQYSLIYDLALSSSHEKNSTARVAISCRPKAATFTGANQTDRNAAWRA